MNHRAVGSAPGRDLDLLLTGGSALGLGLGDGALLDRVSAGPSPAAEAAFDALIRRHGPMVARVCGGILGDHHTAEDAAQAVFLVLLRRARSIRDPDRLAPWLYGVALRTAREARRRLPSLPLTLNEASMIDPTLDPSQTTIRREQADLLYGAIARLPARYLAPVVLCDLEGLTHAEAAAQLNCPVATVSIRIKRAREKLRADLARHRLDFESVLPPLTTAGLIPRTLAATASAHLLANRVFWITSAAKWKAAVVAALVAGLAAVGAQGNPHDLPQTQPPTVAAPPPPVARQDLPAPKATPALVAAASEVNVGFPTVRDVVDFEQYIGHLVASRTVEIRSQLNGVISSVDVADGDQAGQDQTLFKVADAAILAQLQTAKARQNELRDKADKIRAATRNSGDPAEAQARDQAFRLGIDLAKLNNQVQTVKAPFAGQVTLQGMEVGASVEAGKTPLATISTVDPMRVDFEMDERSFLKIQRWVRARPGTTHLPVGVALSDEEGFPHPGRVLFQTARFDPQKGTCTLHAELPNGDRALIPGLFARIQVEYGDPRPAILVPEKATFRNNNNPFVVVVDDAGVAHRQEIQTGGLFGGLREVKGGIDSKTRIYLVDPQNVVSGAKITNSVVAPLR